MSLQFMLRARRPNSAGTVTASGIGGAIVMNHRRGTQEHGSCDQSQRQELSTEWGVDVFPDRPHPSGWHMHREHEFF